ncbi:IS630 family transposase [Sorangium sp. So ce1389]|uniref:IS630 family transposase n=1 Tax=Sorangium sp. So ce1389 TaxID=3133336 RepID=UPI003F5FB1AF
MGVPSSGWLGEPESYWPWRTQRRSCRIWQTVSRWSEPRSGTSVGGTRRRGCTSSTTLPGRAGRGAFVPLQRVGIEKLACCDPAGLGLHMTHWSTRPLAQVAAERGIVPKISRSTVALILREADLQPHRWRYWKTPNLDAAFIKRAAQILWCYENAADLAKKHEVVLCLDEKPNIQVLERRRPTLPMRTSEIERREFEYIRHGTVNFMVVLVVHTGKMQGWCLEKNDGEHLRAVLPEVLHEHQHARRVHLIWDGGSSHIACETRAWLRLHAPRVRTLVTPPHASWLNQAELLLRAFTERYLKRGGWKSRQQLIEHLDASWREYNERFAHPITWSWTRPKLRRWAARYAPRLC